MGDAPKGPAGPCPAALGAFGVPARRWRTRVDLYAQIEAARAFLSECEIGPDALANAAAVAGLSPFHFQRTFSEVVGQSPHQYLKARRCALALTLLSKSLSIAEVALECGFASPAAFSREFKRNFDVSPREFRKIGKDTPNFLGNNTPN